MTIELLATLFAFSPLLFAGLNSGVQKRALSTRGTLFPKPTFFSILLSLLISISPFYIVPYLLSKATFGPYEEFVWFVWISAGVAYFVSMNWTIYWFVKATQNKGWRFLHTPLFIGLGWAIYKLFMIVASFTL